MSDEKIFEERPDEFLAFSNFKKEIESQANLRSKEIIQGGKEEATKIVEASKKEADKYKSDLLNKAKSEANQIKVREVSRKKLSAKMDYLEVRDRVFEELIVEAKSKLQAYTKSGEYSAFLKGILKESAVSMNGGELIIQLRSEDKSLLSQDILDSVAKEVKGSTGVDTIISISKDDLKALGGMKLIRSDNRLFVDNTFEARLARKEEDIRISLVEILEN